MYIDISLIVDMPSTTAEEHIYAFGYIGIKIASIHHRKACVVLLYWNCHTQITEKPAATFDAHRDPSVCI